MNIRYTVLFFIMALIGIESCKDNDNVFKPVTTSALNIVNASPNTLNYYLNGTRQNNTSSLYPAGSVGLQFVPAGLQNYAFKINGQSDALFSYPLTLTVNTINTLYVTGSSVSGVFKSVDTIPNYKDTLSAYSIRFANAAPDAGNLDVYVGDTVNFKSRVYKSTSIFLLSTSGTKEVKIYRSGSTTTSFDTLITFQPYTNYTIFAKGLLNGTGNSKFGVGIVTNTSVANN